MNRYGSFQQLCQTFSFGIIDKVATVPLRACGGSAPSLVRLDTTYGNGSSEAWLYDILQATFAMLGVTSEKLSQLQILDISRSISSQYRNMKVTEFLLFLSNFKAGKYGRFYGGDSYVLVIMKALDKFYNEERVKYIEELERQERTRKFKESQKGVISFDEFKKTEQFKKLQEELKGKGEDIIKENPLKPFIC